MDAAEALQFVGQKVVLVRDVDNYNWLTVDNDPGDLEIVGVVEHTTDLWNGADYLAFSEKMQRKDIGWSSAILNQEISAERHKFISGGMLERLKGAGYVWLKRNEFDYDINAGEKAIQNKIDEWEIKKAEAEREIARLQALIKPKEYSPAIRHLDLDD